MLLIYGTITITEITIGWNMFCTSCSPFMFLLLFISPNLISSTLQFCRLLQVCTFELILAAHISRNTLLPSSKHTAWLVQLLYLDWYKIKSIFHCKQIVLEFDWNHTETTSLRWRSWHNTKEKKHTRVRTKHFISESTLCVTILWSCNIFLLCILFLQVFFFFFPLACHPKTPPLPPTAISEDHWDFNDNDRHLIICGLLKTQR